MLLNLKQLRVESAKEKMGSQADRMICDIILGCWSTEEVPYDDLQYFSRVEYYNYLGIKYFNAGSVEEALSNFSLALKEKSLRDLE